MAVEDGLVSDPGGLPLISEGRAGRLIAVGDIHGCSIALRTLIDAIAPNPDETIVALGDVIDCGPDSKGVLDQLITLSSRCHLVTLLRNHEEMLLNALDSRSEFNY
jgi:serine/threonine protein phosphatase 1